jgi:hypothetical protein
MRGRITQHNKHNTVTLGEEACVSRESQTTTPTPPLERPCQRVRTMNLPHIQMRNCQRCDQFSAIQHDRSTENHEKYLANRDINSTHTKDCGPRLICSTRLCNTQLEARNEPKSKLQHGLKNHNNNQYTIELTPSLILVVTQQIVVATLT